ncbi:MAG: YqzL family protein [Clostridiales bacterium]|nr:YqzL family protein [Clostridiales bacterium]
MKASAEFLWKIFEQTGSIAIYMFYRRISLQ